MSDRGWSDADRKELARRITERGDHDRALEDLRAERELTDELVGVAQLQAKRLTAISRLAGGHAVAEEPVAQASAAGSRYGLTIEKVRQALDAWDGELPTEAALADHFGRSDRRVRAVLNAAGTKYDRELIAAMSRRSSGI